MTASSKMGTVAEKKVVRARETKEKAINFLPSKVAAPFFLRCGAFLIDYILFLLAPVAAMLLSRYFGNDGARLVGGSLNDFGWLIASLIGLTNFIVLPIFMGRSLGKMVVGLRIVGSDGSKATISQLLIRQVLGYILTVLTLGLGFLLSAFNRSGRALHDFVSSTVVIFADRRLR